VVQANSISQLGVREAIIIKGKQAEQLMHEGTTHYTTTCTV